MPKVTEFNSNNRRPSFERSAISRRFQAPAGKYLASVTANDDGSISYKEIMLDDGRTLTLVPCAIEVQKGKQPVKGEIACADAESFETVETAVKGGGKVLIDVTINNGTCYSRIMSAFEAELFAETLESKEKEEVQEQPQIEA